MILMTKSANIPLVVCYTNQQQLLQSSIHYQTRSICCCHAIAIMIFWLLQLSRLKSLNRKKIKTSMYQVHFLDLHYNNELKFDLSLTWLWPKFDPNSSEVGSEFDTKVWDLSFNWTVRKNAIFFPIRLS